MEHFWRNLVFYLFIFVKVKTDSHHLFWGIHMLIDFSLHILLFVGLFFLLFSLNLSHSLILSLSVCLSFSISLSLYIYIYIFNKLIMYSYLSVRSLWKPQTTVDRMLQFGTKDPLSIYITIIISWICWEAIITLIISDRWTNYLSYFFTSRDNHSLPLSITIFLF